MCIRDRTYSAADSPVLIDDGQNLARLGLHHDNRTGMSAKRVDRGGSNLQVLTLGVVFRNICDRFNAQAVFKCSLAGYRLAASLFAATLLGYDRGTAFRLFAASFCKSSF